MTKAIRAPKAARELLEPLARRAEALGLPLFVVGGCVRDWLRGAKTYDLDLVAVGDPAPLAVEAARLLGGTAESFGQFGTFRVLSPSRFRVDLATARREEYPKPASLPVVTTPAPIEEDLKRRDFTVNAMALALTGSKAGQILDPFGGAEDLAAGRLRLLHAQSLSDDPTRAFRAARYAVRLKLSPDAAGPLALLERWGYLSLFGGPLPAPPPALRGVEERLGAMTLLLNEDAPGFLGRLALDRRLSGDLHELLRLIAEERAPRDEVPAAARAVLRALRPDLPASALKPLFVSGEDLKALGLKPGPAFKNILDDLAALQWLGKITTRRQALTHLGRKGAQ